MFGRLRRAGCWLLVLGSVGVFAQPADAGTVEITPDLDCVIDSATGDGDCASEDLFVAVEGSDAIFHHVGLLQFDLAGNLPLGATVDSAELKLHLRSSYTGSLDPEAFEAHQLLDPWTSGVDWSTSDGVTPWGTTFDWDYFPYQAADSVNIAHGLTGTTISWDVTGVAQLWATNSDPNHGLLVRGALDALITREAIFASSDDEDDDLWPVLEVEYSE